MNRLIVFCGLSVALPLFAGCALFQSNAVPPSPTLTGVAAQNTAWRDQVHRGPHGGTPSFGPLSDAKKAVQAAQSQNRVDDFDSQSLSQAKEKLSEAKKAWQDLADKKKPSNDALAKVAGKAHRARRLAQIAQYTAQREIGLKQLNQLQSQQQQQQMAVSGGNISGSDLVKKRVVPEMLGSLHFQSGTARLTEDSHAVVKKLAKLVQAHPQLGVAIFGFTDSSEPSDSKLQAFVEATPKLKKQHPNHDQKVKAYQQGLADARARDVAQLLVQAGVDPHHIGARGMGASHPVASNDSTSGRRQNNRAEAVMVPLKQSGG